MPDSPHLHVTCSLKHHSCLAKHLKVMLTPAPAPVPPCRELAVPSNNLSPFSSQVTLCSNTVQKYELALVVDVEGVGEEVLALLITAR